MSTEVNTQLLEEAAELIDRWVGTTRAAVLEADLERNDLESLALHVKELRDLDFQEFYNPEEPNPEDLGILHA